MICPHQSVLFPVPASNISSRFIVYGDWGLLYQNESTPSSLLEASAALDFLVMSCLDALQGKMSVINVGDSFYMDGWEPGLPNYGGVVSVHDPQWRTKFVDMFRSQIPWWSVLGNHDFMGNISAQIQFAELGYDNRWNFPAPFYEKTFAGSINWLFLETNVYQKEYWNATDIGSIDCNTNCSRQFLEVHGNTNGSSQLAWMTAQLGRLDTNMHSHGECMFAVGHHPPETIPDVMELLLEFHVHAYFYGHTHLLQHGVAVGKDGWQLELFTSGAGGILPEKISWGILPEVSLTPEELEEKGPSFSNYSYSYDWAQTPPGFLDLAVTERPESIDQGRRVVGTFFNTGLTALRTRDFQCASRLPMPYATVN